MITELKIIKLFNNTWREMHAQELHLEPCINNYNLIEIV
jgi:hypothetical protein